VKSQTNKEQPLQMEVLLLNLWADKVQPLQMEVLQVVAF
jgi:hypothetical protein